MVEKVNDFIPPEVFKEAKMVKSGPIDHTANNSIKVCNKIHIGSS